MEKNKKRTRKEWSTDDTSNLIECWSIHIDDLRRNKRNSAVYEDISNMLKEMSVLKSVAEVKLKIKNLTSKFRAEKKIIGSSGGSPSEWQFYENVAQIIGSIPANDDSLIDESMMEVEYLDYFEQPETASDTQGPSPLPSSSVAVPQLNRRPRKVTAIQEELLQQITRGNDCMQNYCEEAQKYQAEHLKIMKESLNMQTMWYTFFTRNNDENNDINHFNNRNVASNFNNIDGENSCDEL